MNGGVALQPAEHWHLNAARRADPREVVTQQIDDHDVLGPVLFRCEQGSPQGRDPRPDRRRGGRFLDRPRFDDAAAQADEALGRA